MPDGREKAIGTVMVNEFRDTTFGPYDEIVFYVTAVPLDSPASRQEGRIRQCLLASGAAGPRRNDLPVEAVAERVEPDRRRQRLSRHQQRARLLPIRGLSDGTRKFRSWDKELKALVSGKVLRTFSTDVGAVKAAYRAAADRAGTTVPHSDRCDDSRRQSTG